MHEIARLAGVSQSTVSRVLNGKPTVDPEKQAAVMKVIEELKFRPNVAARGLVGGKTMTIGVLTRSLGSPFFAQVLRGVGTALTGGDYSPIMALGADDDDADIDAINLLIERRVDALILQPGPAVQNDYLIDLATEIPLIVIGRCVTGIEKQCVYVRDAAAAYRATTYLIEKGHRIIAHISGMLSHPDAVERQEGYFRALRDHGLSIVPELVAEGDFTEHSGFLATETLLALRARYPFTAIFVANDQMAASARLTLYRHGISVPETISLFGFDDQTNAQFMIPPLSTIRQPAYEMGVLAAQTVLRLLARKPIQIPDLELELVERESVADLR
jgi:LacI family transcriptional regulator